MAFLSATLAGFCAFLAMTHFMLGAFIAASLADIGAELAQRLGELAASCHVRSSHAADLRAIHVQRNAAGHHFYILLLQAGSRTMVARNGAGVACIDAGLKFFM